MRSQPRYHAILQRALAALLVCAQTVGAQRSEGSVDIGAVALRYADTVSASAATITPRAIIDWGRVVSEVSGTYSQFASGGWTTQGALSGSLFTPFASGLLAEVAGFAGGSAHKDGTRTGEILANARLHAMRTRGEFYAGIGAGRTWFGGGSAGLFLGEAGVSTTLRGVTANFVLNPAIVDSLQYMDGQLSLSWTRAKLDLGAFVGVRVGDQLTALGGDARSWGSLSAVRWFGTRLALVATGGTYPIDPTQGFPGGRFASLSIRVASRRSVDAQAAAPTQPPIEATAAEAPPAVSEFAAERAGARAVTLRAKAPRARLVEVSGDFTNWTPVPLKLGSNGWWDVTLPMEPGKYQMNLRLDGGEWLVPPGLLSMLDEFGGKVGLLVVEPNTRM